MFDRQRIGVFVGMIGLSVLLGTSRTTYAQTLSGAFAGSYTIFDLGTPDGVPGPFGGLTLLAGSSNTLLLGGSANNGSGAIYSIGLTRDGSGHINGFSGSASLFSTAPNIDGGLTYAPNGTLLYTAFPTNQMGQIKPGSTTPDKTVDLTGIGSSVGALGFVPAGFTGAGAFKIVSFNTGQFYDVALTPDGSGTFNVASASLTATLAGGPEGFVYVPSGSPLFSTPTMLVSEYGAGQVGAYSIDAAGNPIVSSRVDFMTGLTGAEGAFIDPSTGDFLFSTFGGGNRVIAVRGFASVVPEPGSIALLGLGIVGLIAARRRLRVAG